jgi:flagellar basal-body rod protein FlgB
MELKNESAAKISIDYTGITKADGNNVDIDQQMANLAQNSSDYAGAAQLMRHKLSLTKTAIRDSR